MTKINKLIYLLLLGLFLIPQAQAEWVDISPSVEITQTPQALDRVKRVLFSYVTITNTSAEALVDPVRLVITNPSIPVLNATGTTEAGDVYLEVAGGLSAGEKTTIRVDFQLARVKLVFGGELQEFQNLVAGRVADGYLVGVTVCIDLNANRKCDAEPNAMTTDGGHYSIALPKNIEISDYSMVAEVPKGVIDEDDGQPIEHGYTLSAPAGYSFFISPISSVIHTTSYVEQITAQQAAEKLRSELGLEQSIDMFGDYISSNEMDDATKKKLHTIAQITAKIMAENHDLLISTTQISGLDSADSTKNILDAINLHIERQLKSIGEIADDIPEGGNVTDATINPLDAIDPLTGLYSGLAWDNSQIKTFEEHVPATMNEIDNEVDDSACSAQTVNEKRSLAGLKYCIDIQDNKEEVRHFEVTAEEQKTLIYIENLYHKVNFELFKKEDGLYKKVKIPYRYIDASPGGAFLWYGYYSSLFMNYEMLPQGEYKVVFQVSGFWPFQHKNAKAEVHINSEVVDRFPIIDTGAFSPYELNVNPYELEVGKPTHIVGTLQSLHDRYLNQFDEAIEPELKDVIPLRSSGSIASINLKLESDEKLNVAVVNAVYLSKIRSPKIVQPEDGILWSGDSNDLKNQSFLFPKQQDQNAYYVIITTGSDNAAWSSVAKYIKYKLTVTPQPVLPVVFKASNKSYQAKWSNLDLIELIDRVQLFKPANVPVVKENEFYYSEADAKDLTSALQTLHTVMSFDEGAMMQFYDEYVSTIDNVGALTDTIFVTGELSSIIINAYSFDPVGLAANIEKISLTLKNQSVEARAESIGASFLQYGFNVLRSYQDKKKTFIDKYQNGEAIDAQFELTDKTLSELTRLYILQQRAVLFIKYGMDVYMSTADLEKKSLFEFITSRVFEVFIASLDPGMTQAILSSIDNLGSLGKIFLDSNNDTLTLSIIESTQNQMWGSLVDADNYHSFYTNEVQENNISILVGNGFEFESTHAKFTNQESLKTCIQDELKITDNSTPTFEQLASITNLTCNNKSIEDISVLAYLTDLKLLTLNDNQIKDISPLLKLKNLDSVIILDNPDFDCSPLVEHFGTYSVNCGMRTLVGEPKNFRAESKDGALLLKWDPEPNAKFYYLYYSTNDFLPLPQFSIDEIRVEKPYMLDGLTNGEKYFLYLEAYDVNNNFGALATALATPSDGIITGATGKLNDTGITWGDESYGNFENCIGIEGQDCSYGRDAQAARGTLTKIGGGHGGFDFTKLDSDGAALPADAMSWSCVRDNHTGLVWEIKTDDGRGHDKSNNFRWGGVTALGNNDNGTYYDDWNTLVNISNSESLCGFSNWRVPSVNELVSIVDFGRQSFEYINYFPNSSSRVWSSLPYGGNSGYAWYVDFINGGINGNLRNNFSQVRLVSGE